MMYQAVLFPLSVSLAAAWQSSTHGVQIQRPRQNTACYLVPNQDDDIQPDLSGRRRFLLQLSSSVVVLPLASTAAEGDTATIKAVENVVKEEQDLDNKLKQEELDESKSIEDTKNLITEIEDEIKSANSKADEASLIAGEEKIASDTEALIKEEEQIVNETQAMISEIETMESEVKQLDKDSTNPESSKSEEFVNKLKQRVEEKEDLITKLKRESEMFRDPTTGKFKPMSQEEFKKRALSTETEYDYVQILRDSLTNNQEFEQDLEAFEGLLERNFGGIIKELKKDENAVETELEALKDGAESFIKQLRRLF